MNQLHGFLLYSNPFHSNTKWSIFLTQGFCTFQPYPNKNKQSLSRINRTRQLSDNERRKIKNLPQMWLQLIAKLRDYHRNPTTMTNKVKSSISPIKQLKTQKVGQNRAIKHKRTKLIKSQYY